MTYIEPGSIVKILSGYRAGCVGCVGSVKFAQCFFPGENDYFFVLVGVVFEDGETEIYAGHQLKLYTEQEQRMDADLAALVGVAA